MQPIFKKTFFSLLILCCVSTANLWSQKDSSSCAVRMMARATPDSILLRWAPVNYETWRKGIRSGYKVLRYTLYKNGALTTKKQAKQLTPQPLKPYPLDKWELMAETNNYAGVAAQAVYGNDFTPQADNTSPVISIFNKATEQQNRFAFSLFAADASAPVAKAMGLYYADHQVVAGEKYLYMVFPASGDPLPCDTAFVYTGTDEYVPLVKPVISEIIPGNKTATLQWKSPEGRWGYTAFELQRSADNGKSFTAVNTAPLINTFPDKPLQDFNFYIDSLPDNHLRYTYRLRGINPFGEKGPFSDTLSLLGKEPLGTMPHITSHETLTEGVRLQWDFDKNSEGLIHGFKVMRSVNSTTGFETVNNDIPANIRSYTDKHPLPTAYYTVTAWNDRGGLATSFPVLVQLIDSIPPAPPVGLTGTVDTSGLVNLHWNANTESDIYGYRVYRANSRTEEFSQLTVAPIRDTLFKDKIVLKTLSPHVYYKVLANDKRQNHSAFSAVLEIKRPDVVPPVTPVIRDVYSSSKGVTILWVHSSSPDVAKEHVLRREAGSSKWERYAGITKLDSLYTDSLSVTGTRYEYALQATDEGGLTSVIDQVVTGVRLEARPQKPVLKVEVKKSESMILLHWVAMPKGKCMIYRSEDNAPLRLHAACPENVSGFSDKKINPGHTYRYALKVVGEKGVVVSDVVTVSY
jgi:uncharacterized protein